MNRSELFSPVPLESLSREKVRPLGYLSDFCIDAFPILLKQVDEQQMKIEELVALAEMIAEDGLGLIEEIAEGEDEDKLLLARLDILLVQAGIIHSGGKVGPNLEALIRRVCELTARPAGLTYEDIVINNPQTDIRTFTTGLMGKSEADFYNGHRYIEEILEPSVQSLREVLENEALQTPELITVVLQQTLDSLNQLVSYTATISQKMPVAHFKDGFRKYLGVLSGRDVDGNDIKGPSGAFTARVPIIEYLIMGETIKDEERDYTLTNLRYFPLEYQYLLLKSLENARAGLSLKQILELQGSPAEATTILNQIQQIFIRFRSVHLGAANKHLADVIAQQEPGTGGENIVDFLETRRQRTIDSSKS